MEFENNIAGSKLEIILMLLSKEDAEISRKIPTIGNRAKRIEENEKITLISYGADTMNKISPQNAKNFRSGSRDKMEMRGSHP